MPRDYHSNRAKRAKFLVVFSCLKFLLTDDVIRIDVALIELQKLPQQEKFIQTFLERDIRKSGVQVPPPALRLLWHMLAHCHGKICNASELAWSLDESYMTVKRHVDILTGALMTRQLQPWFEHLNIRQVKAPKVYVRDIGLLHGLLALDSFADSDGHPKLGAFWEGCALEQVLHITGDRTAYFWATQSGAELDLMASRRGKRIGFEFINPDAPSVTKFIHVAIQDLKLEHLYIIYSGRKSYFLRDKVECLSMADLHDRLEAA